MATFTIELRRAIERYDGNIGLDIYPIFREEYRETLNKKIVDHYWNREIGTETVQLFRLAMRRRMNEIMPYYNQLYLSELHNIDPFITASMRHATDTESESANVSDVESTNKADSKSRSVNSEFPQVKLSNDSDYATNASDAIGGTTGESTVSERGSNDGKSSSETVSTGFTGSMSSLLMEYRNTFLNIDLEIINNLDDLFMSIWNINEPYSKGMTGYDPLTWIYY